MAKKKNKSRDYIEDWAAGCTMRPCAADYISSVSDILHRDYHNLECRDYSDIYAWDADGYEHKKYGHQSSETVDMVFAMDYGKMLMVEAKLNVRNVDNIKGEVEDKISHTRNYIVSSTSFRSLITPSVVLFGQKRFHEFYNRFRRLNNNKTNIKPMTISSFYKEYFGTITVDGF